MTAGPPARFSRAAPKVDPGGFVCGPQCPPPPGRRVASAGGGSAPPSPHRRPPPRPKNDVLRVETPGGRCSLPSPFPGARPRRSVDPELRRGTPRRSESFGDARRRRQLRLGFGAVQCLTPCCCETLVRCETLEGRWGSSTPRWKLCSSNARIGPLHHHRVGRATVRQWKRSRHPLLLLSGK